MNLINFVFRLFILAFSSLPWAGLSKYSDVVHTSVMNSYVEIDYERQIEYNESLDIPTIAVTRSFTNMKEANSTIIKGFDMVVKPDIIELAEAFTSQPSGDTELTITLNTDDKNYLTDYELIRFKFLPTGANYTNFCVVTDKQQTTNRTTIKIRPHDYATSTAGKIGIASGIEIPAGTKILLMGTRLPRGQETFAGTSTHPTVISGYFQDIRWPFSVDDIATLEKLYIGGTEENRLARLKKMEFNKIREASWLFNGTGWEQTIADPTKQVENSNFPGIWTSIYNGSSPAKVGYDSFSLDILDDYCVKLDNSAIDNKSKIWFTLCNQALINQISKAKRDSHHGIDIMDTDSYGIPGVKRVKWGSITLDLHNHYLFDKLWPDQTKPMCMSLTLGLLKYKYKMKEHIRQNLPTTGTKLLNEYRIVEGYLMHQINTSYWGLMYNNEEIF